MLRPPVALVSDALLALFALGLPALGLSALAGCGDDSADGAGGGETSGSGGSGGQTVASTSEASTGAGGGQTPEELVPPESLGGDPAEACPGAYAGTAPAAGLNEDFDAAGQARAFHLIEPDASFTGPRPLFVAFNGTGESGPSFSARAGLEDLAAKGFVVLAPSSEGNGTLWPVWDSMHQSGTDDPESNPDLVLFDDLVACVAAHRDIDENRLYVGGHSAGGIMANYVLQRRSELLAGGIAASGVFSLTSPEPAAPLDDMFVIVTWGGDNDEYSGGSGGVAVPSINFVEQASIASAFYDAEANVSQAYCRGDDLGHAWLDPLNAWFADALLAHPKGLALKGETTLAALPDGAPASCSGQVYTFESDLLVECPGTSTTEGCAEVCQFIGDCAVENATVGPILAPQLASLGFSGEDNEDCGGCITHCEETAVEATDAEVLGCLGERQGASICGPGIDGALPIIDAINACCEGRDDSPWCVDTCTILWTNTAARGLLSSCEPLITG